MKRPITPAYSFAPGSGTLNLSGITGFDVRNLFAVIDLRTGALVYAPVAGYGFSALSGTTLTLQAPMTGLAASDPLMILYDDGNRPAEDASVQAVTAAVGTLATQLSSNHGDLAALHADVGTTLHGDLAAILAKLGAKLSVSIDGSSVALNLPSGLALDASVQAVVSGLATLNGALASNHGDLSAILGDLNTGLTNDATALAAIGATATWQANLLAAAQKNAVRVQSTGTLTASGDTVVLGLDGMNTAVVQLAAGGWGGGPVLFEASADNQANWTAVAMLLYAGSAPVSSTTVGGLWEMACGGLTHLRIRAAAAITGGSGVGATLAATNGLKSIRVGNPSLNPLFVTVGKAATAGDASVTTGGTAQTLFAGATPANGWKVANPDPAEDLWVSDSATAAPNGSGCYRVPAGGIVTTEPGERPYGPVSVYAATSGHPITARSW